MSVPDTCTVLVVGGGPAGSFAAAALARDGIDVVLVDADKFPRYHIGESMLPSIRHFLKFIDCDDKWINHGFIKKKGAAFKLNWTQPDAYTDFIAAAGPNGYAWNVIRSESDEILFKHAGECGAHIFDATKIESINFVEDAETKEAWDSDLPNPGRPVSAIWARKDGSTGLIAFKYLIDASGRQGISSTKYLKNRKFNQSLKNIANWGYWTGAGVYGVGTHKEGSPYFEALKDASGWCWFIPLHDGTVSVGIVQNQEQATAKKRAQGSPSSKDFYLNSLDLVPGVKALCGQGTLVSDIKSASDWSYTASSYAFPYARIIGDAGCFIDPFFSSGVHLAILGGLSAAVTIAGSMRGDCDEKTAALWHSKKITESYTRFFLVVSSALKQIRSQEEPVINDIDEEGFQRAFDLFKPVIQGTVDADSNGRFTQADISKAMEFCFKAFTHVTPEEKDALVEKLKSYGLDARADDESTQKAIDEIEKNLTAEELQVLNILRSRRMVREDGYNIDSFTLDAVDGLSPNMVRGKLGLKKAESVKLNISNLYSIDYLEGKTPGVRVPNSQDSSKESMNGHGLNEHSNGIENSMKEGITGSVNGSMRNGTPATREELEGMVKLITPLNNFGSAMDDLHRHALMSALYQAAESLETPFDTLMRFSNSRYQLSLIKVGYQLGVFEALVASSAALTAEELAKHTGADPKLVSRVVRYLAANRIIVELGENLYEANKITKYMADPHMEGGMKYFHTVSSPTVHKLPEFLQENNFQNPIGEPSVWHKSKNTAMNLFAWLKANQPETLKHLHNLRAFPKERNWLSCIPFAQFSETDRIAFVGMGRNVEHECLRLKEAHPKLAGRIVLQHLPETPQHAPMIKDVTFISHDIFTPQPVKGAQYYYLRRTLHHWSDEQVVEILRNLVPAMALDSQVLIDEIVLPNTAASAPPAAHDLEMMIMFGAMERTINQWNVLLDHAGLKAVEVKTYEIAMQSSIIFAQLK